MAGPGQGVTSEQGGLGALERTVAPIVGLLALALGIIGLLVAFGIVGPEGVADDPTDPAGTGQGLITDRFMDGMLWKITGISAAFLFVTLNRSAHRHGEAEGGMYHAVAYVMAVAAIVAGVLALLVGFNLLGMDTTQTDGMVWAFASLLYSVIAAGAHYAPRPYSVPDDDYIVSVVESRVGGYRGAPGTSGAGATRTERVPE